MKKMTAQRLRVIFSSRLLVAVRPSCFIARVTYSRTGERIEKTAAAARAARRRHIHAFDRC
jgi:hypothetical protein